MNTKNLWLPLVSVFLMHGSWLWALESSGRETSVSTQTPTTQERANVGGTVVDAETGQPLRNVFIWLQGTEHSAVTDKEGRFELRGIVSGPYVLGLSTVNYVYVRRQIEVTSGGQDDLTISLPGGTATYTETVNVVAPLYSEAESVSTVQALNGIPLQNLSCGVIDDPVRAVQSLPGVVTGDDYQAEFSVRGNGPERIGTSFEGVPTSLLLYAIHQDDVTASAINSDTVENITLSTGAYPQRYGDRTGAWMDITMREGSREKTQVHALVGMTTSSVTVGGPLASGKKGSYLLSARLNYMDKVLRMLDQTSSAFGMLDTQGKIVYDFTDTHQLQLAWLGGRLQLDNSHERDFATPSDDWRTDSRTGLLTAALRSTFGSRLMLTQRVAAVLNRYRAEGFFGSELKRGSRRELSYRADVTVEPSEASLIEAGIQTHNNSGALNIMGYGWADAPQEAIETLRDDRYTGEARRHGAYVSYRWRPSQSWTFSPGIRADRFSLTGENTLSPWFSVGWTPSSNWQVTAGTGIYHQFPGLEPILGPTGGGRDLRAERAWHTDLSIARQLSSRTKVVATLYNWEERDGIRLINGEPRIVNSQLFWPRYTGQWHANTLEGSSRGLELKIENKNPNGLSGWLSYSLSRTRYRDVVQNEEFWGDYDQRHTFNAYAQYRWSHRSSISALFRYGSNYPLVGYYENLDGVMYVGSSRNELRLPYYARLDVRADRSYDFTDYRLTLFAQVLNVLDRVNYRRQPHGVGPSLQYNSTYESLLGLTPTVGVLIEF